MIRMLVAVALPAVALAAPSTFTHNGRLLDSFGTPLDGSQSLTVALEDAIETRYATTGPVIVSDGYYEVTLTPPDSVWDYTGLEVVVSLGTTELSRQLIGAVPYAARVGSGAFTGQRALLGTSQLLNFRFEEGGGGAAFDQSPTGTIGVLGAGTAGDPSWVTGVQGTALGFDGVDDCLVMSNSGRNQIYGSMTAMAWIKPTAAPSGAGRVFAKHYTNNQRSWDITYGGDGIPYFEVFDASSVNYPVYGDAAIPQNAWTHVAGTYDRTTGTSTFYVNGVQTDTRTDAVGNVAVTTLEVTVGCYLDAPSNNYRQFFTGHIDDVLLMGEALTQEQIQAYLAGF